MKVKQEKIIKAGKTTILCLGLLLMFGCGQKGKATEEVYYVSEQDSIDSVNEKKNEKLAVIIKNAYENKLSQYDLIRIPEVKEFIIRSYSQKFYDMMLENTQVVGDMTYDPETQEYRCHGWKAHENGSTGSEMIYYEKWKMFLINLKINGYDFKSDGTMDYGYWSRGYYTDEFGEKILDQPYIELEIDKAPSDTPVDYKLHVRFNDQEGFKIYITEGDNDRIINNLYELTIRVKYDNETKEVIVDKRYKGHVTVYNEESVRILAEVLYGGTVEEPVMISIINTDILGYTRSYLFKLDKTTQFLEALTLLK